MTFNPNNLFSNGTGRFYHYLYLCMIATITGNLYSLFLTWHILNLGGKISSISGLIMSSLFLFFFKYLRDTSPKPIPENESALKSNEDILKLMQGGQNEKELKTLS